MNGRQTTATLVGITAGALSIGAAGADISMCFEVDGELPSVEAGIEYYSLNIVPEPTGFSVQGGLLLQRLAPVIGPTGYFFPAFPPVGGGLDPAKPIVIEARLRVIQIENLGGVWFGALEGLTSTTRFFPATVSPWPQREVGGPW